jgi:hypothetical protein
LPVEEVVSWLARGEAAHGKPVSVLLDQVDALSLSMARDTRPLDAVSNLVARLRGMPGVRVLLSCRTFDLNTTPALTSLDIKRRFSLPDLSMRKWRTCCAMSASKPYTSPARRGNC